MNIVFIRHSKSLVNPDIPITSWGLSEEGVALAKKLHELEQIKTLEALYTSLQTKALETAVLVTKNSGIGIKIDNRLTESTSFTNKFVSAEQFEINTKDYFRNPKVSITSGETMEESLIRFNSALSEIVNSEKKNTIGIVSHGNILASFASQYVAKNAYEIVEDIKQPDIAVFNWDIKQFITFFGDIQI